MAESTLANRDRAVAFVSHTVNCIMNGAFATQKVNRRCECNYAARLDSAARALDEAELRGYQRAVAEAALAAAPRKN